MQDYQSNSPSSMLLDLAGTGPLHARLAGALRAAIRDGRLRPGSVLPPSRVLAAELGCSRWVVTQAYSELVTAGYLEARTGSGTRVRPLSDTGGPGGEAGAVRTGTGQGRPAPGPAPRQSSIDMAPGLPDLRHFPVARWAGAIRSAAAVA